MNIQIDRAKEIFLDALEIDSSDDRRHFLDRACCGEAALLAEVEDLLSHHPQLGSFLSSVPHNLDATASLVASSSDDPGTTFGPYKILEQIGEGGFGVVYLAEQTHPVRRRIALKVLKPGMDTRHVVARFEAERQALALMDHPNIARVLDGGESAAGRPYFVMELVKGIPATDFCDRNRLNIRGRLELFVQVCRAVQHAHQKGVIHRDLKPTNILVSLHDGAPVPKVIDFGIAKAIGQPLTEKTLFTGFAQMIGTPLYMSPEQAELSGLDVDTRSDIYSLGVLLYELLTGTTPFDQDRLRSAGIDEVRRIIREEEPARPSTRVSTLGQSAATVSANRESDPKHLSRLIRGELDWIVMKALEKDRNRRYETVAALVADLHRYLVDEPVLACPPSAGYRLRKFARRNKRALATASILLCFFMVLGGAAGWYLRDRSARLAVTAENVERSIAAAEDLLRKGRLPEAILAAQTCQALLDFGGGSDELRLHVRELTNDLALAERLEEARLEAARHVRYDYDDKITMRAYAAAFRELDLDVESLGPVEIADRIRRRSIRGYLVQALDNWAGNRAVDPEVKRRLMAIITDVDTDPWRNRLRGSQADVVTLKQLAAAPEAQSQPPASLCLLAEYLERLGAAEAAVTLLTEAQRRHPDDFWVNHTLGFHQMARRPSRWDEAIRFFSAAVALRPNSAGARSKLGWALERAQRFDEAIANYRFAVLLNPNHASSRFYLGHVLIFPKQDYEGAVAQFSRILEIYPGDPPTLRERAAAYRYLGRIPEAHADLEQAIKRDPNQPTGWFGRAEVYKALGQKDKAIADYSRAIELAPDYVLAINRRLDLYAERNDNENTIKDLSRLIKLLPQDRVPLLRRANLYRKLHQRDKAIADYTETINHPGGTVSPQWSLRGWAYAESGRFREAIPDLAKAVDQEPKMPYRRFDHAIACLAAGDLKAYRDVCAEMLKRLGNTTDPEVAGRVVLTCVAGPDAVADRAQVVKLAEMVCKKNHIFNLGLLGAAYYRAGDSRRAVEYFTELPRTQPRAWDWCFQAMAHQSLGQSNEARKCLDSADKWLAIVGPPGPDGPGKPIPHWYNWQDESGVQLLRREATKVSGIAEESGAEIAPPPREKKRPD